MHFTLAGRVVSDRGGVIVGYQGDGPRLSTLLKILKTMRPSPLNRPSLIDAIESEIFSGTAQCPHRRAHRTVGWVNRRWRLADLHRLRGYGERRVQLERAFKSLGVSVLISDATACEADEPWRPSRSRSDRHSGPRPAGACVQPCTVSARLTNARHVRSCERRSETTGPMKARQV